MVTSILKKIWIVLIFARFLDAYQLDVGPCPLEVQEPCSKGSIKFILYANSSYAEILDPFKPRLPSFFNRTASTKIIIHGYTGHMDYATLFLSRAYVESARYNVISVDWDLLSRLPCYPTAAANTWQAGQCTAVFVVGLAAAGIDPKYLHVLGFSLGAHVASYASNWISSTMGTKFGRITGLDPALPFFASLNEDWKLDSGDAYFVDILHTNSGVYGKIEATGHVDFYVNGGTFQPACQNNKNPPLCSHMLAPIYFAESITSPFGFQGFECPGYLQYVLGWCRASESNKTVIMGEYSQPYSRGVYFVDTTASTPFAIQNRP